MNLENELRRVAKQYQDEGYTVTLRPHGDAVPAFAREFDLDLIAARGSESVIVEVSANRSALASDTQALRLADAISKQPGWRFDVVVVQSDRDTRNPYAHAGEPTAEQVRGMFAEAERLLGVSASAALVTAWAGFEATMRGLAQKAGIGGRTGTNPATLLRELYASGFLSPDELKFADELRAVRSAVVHGFAPTAVSEPAARRLIELGRHKLTESERLQPAVA
jgi:hypothetical protein